MKLAVYTPILIFQLLTGCLSESSADENGFDGETWSRVIEWDLDQSSGQRGFQVEMATSQSCKIQAWYEFVQGSGSVASIATVQESRGDSPTAEYVHHSNAAISFSDTRLPPLTDQSAPGSGTTRHEIHFHPPNATAGPQVATVILNSQPTDGNSAGSIRLQVNCTGEPDEFYLRTTNSFVLFSPASFEAQEYRQVCVPQDCTIGSVDIQGGSLQFDGHHDVELHLKKFVSPEASGEFTASGPVEAAVTIGANADNWYWYGGAGSYTLGLDYESTGSNNRIPHLFGYIADWQLLDADSLEVSFPEP